jgi:hypothetical protein
MREIFLTVFFEPALAIRWEVGEGPKEFRELPMGELALPVLSWEYLRALFEELNRRTLEVFRAGDEIGLLEVPVLGTDTDTSVFIDCSGSQRSSERIRLFIMF